MAKGFLNCGSNGSTAGTDDLGRVLPQIGETGPLRENRYVGMFYFLWLELEGQKRDPRPLDITKLLLADPKAGYRPNDSEWGKWSEMHHWGEPMYGYYYSDDEWVMRRHVELLTYAGIDFLVFDTTNALIYEEHAKMMLRLLSEYRSKGFNTPKAMFYTNTQSGKTVQKLYDAIYKPGYMSDSWFCFDGKPLIIAIEDECSQETRDFFTIKMSQWPNEPTKKGGWPWMDFERPQRVFENLKGEEEIINVSVAQHPQIRFGDSAMYGEEANRGRSFHNGKNDHSEGAYKYGYNFQEQWDRAIETDPPYVFVTGWNEWIAGNWGDGKPPRPLCFVDCANLEYSRDIEPMKGGYKDNYYMQLIANVRRYKGCEPLRAYFPGEKAAYKGFPGGAAPRDCDGYNTHYTDNSGRNEIVEAGVSFDSENLYFTAKTTENITKYDYSSAWMQLFLNVKNITNPGNTPEYRRWKGYNYLVNTYQFTDSRTAVSACTETSPVIDDNTFKPCGIADYSVNGSEINITVPKNMLGIGEKDDFTLEFKWADSREAVRRTEDFYTKGSCCPAGRLNFVFIGKGNPQ